jgi:hypothetical protein
MILSKEEAAMACFAIMDTLMQVPREYSTHVLHELAASVQTLQPVLVNVKPGVPATDTLMTAFRQLLSVVEGPDDSQ